jgi:D-alanyl-D-alanine carboxypeptidase
MSMQREGAMRMARRSCAGFAGRALALAAALCVMGPLAIAAPTEKQASFVVDGNTGTVLHAQNADEPRYPASLTKMMTLYLAFEEIAARRMSESTMLTMSVTCAAMAPSKIGLEVGERMSLANAMKAVVTKSANDMACAIAEAVAGSEAAFARRMTKRAREIGMTATTFRNASGLPDPRQITTARDMATLGLRLRDDFPEQYPIFQLRSFSYGGKTYKSHNTLMNGFAGMDGIKTGYTRASGFNLVSSVRRDGKHVVGAVFGGVSASVRNAHMRVILFHALAKASAEKTRKRGPLLIAGAKPAKPPRPQAVATQPPARQPAPAAPKAVAATGPETTADAPAIKIAKVKAVMVAGAAANTQPPAAAGLAAVAEQPAPPRPRPQFVTASAAPRLGMTQQNPAAAAAPPPPPPTETARRPSTLNAQSHAMTGNAAKTVAPAKPQPPAAQPARPAKVAAAAGAGDYLIQVGAFATADEADKHLESVRGRAAKLLKDRPSRTEHAQVGPRQVYRARFAQFDSVGANAACTALRQQKVDCLVLRSQ